MFNCICKLFDNVILLLYKSQLPPSEMQFGFKEKHSTSLCTLMYSEIINHYTNNKSNVYSCLLDASKAFDLVHFGKLFRILLSTDIPRCIIRLIFDSYIRQRACVTWNSTKSLYFSIHNGVKQGGVISPIFFNLYLDPMLIRLRESRIGCHINNVFTGALAVLYHHTRLQTPGYSVLIPRRTNTFLCFTLISPLTQNV